MKAIKDILVLLVIISSTTGKLSYAQPKIHKENMLTNIPSDVRQQIEKLYSKSPIVRANAVVHLRKMGKKATPAISFLVAMLGDHSPLKWVQEWSPVWGPGSPYVPGFPTSPGEEAAITLGQIRDIRVVELLLVALRDKDRFVRKNAADALGRIGDARAVEPLVAALKDESWAVREEAVDALWGIGKPAVEPLIATLKCKNSLAREAAAEALGKIGDTRAVKPLISALKDKDADVREEAAEALGEMRDSRAVEPLIAALKDLPTQREAAEALGKIGDKRAVEPLIAALKDKTWYGREQVILSLGSIGDNRAIEPLIAVLKDKDESLLREKVAIALGEIGKSAVEPLIVILKDKDESLDVRKEAAKALGETKDYRAIEPLIDALKDWAVDSEAAEALMKITGTDFGGNYAAWPKWWERNKGRVFKR